MKVTYQGAVIGGGVMGDMFYLLLIKTLEI